MRLAQAQFADRLLDPARTRRNHRLGDAGAARIEQVGEVAQARLHLAELVVGELGHRLALAEHAEHAADPDHLVAGRRQARLVAGLQGEDQRRAAQLLDLAHAHADQRTVGGHDQLDHVAVDAVGLGEVGLGASRRYLLAFFIAGQQPAREQREVGQARQQQRNADRCDREQAEGLDGLRAGRQVAVRAGDQVVEQDQRRIRDHRDVRAAQDHARHRQQQPLQRQAGARADAADHGQEQRRQGLALDHGGEAADHRVDQQRDARFDAAGQAQDERGGLAQHAGAVQARAHDHDRDQRDHRVAGEAVEQLFDRQQPRDADDDDDQQGDEVGADPFEHQHQHREREQREHERHVGGQGQAGVHSGLGYSGGARP